MNRNEAKQEVKRQWRTLIATMTTPARQRVNGETGYICPLCGHGTHGDGLTFNRQNPNGNGLKCFGCGFSGDIIDLYQQHTGADYNTALKDLANELNISIDPYRPDAAADFAPEAARTPQNGAQEAQRGNVKADAQTGTQSRTDGTQADYTEYYRQCAERITDPAAADYLKLRGISLQTAQRYGIGFDPSADPANNPGGYGNSFYPAPRLIIPMSGKCYVARATDPNQAEYKKLFPKGNAGIDLFNTECLYTQEVQEVFITEGAIDALSVIECGRQAAALNSANNAEKLLKLLENRPTRATLIICLDKDSAGRKAAETLCSGLQRLNISFIMADISGAHKDPNEFLTADRAEFEKAIERAARNVIRPDNIFSYLEAAFNAEREQYRNVGKATGFAEWDRLTNGLHKGIYMLAAPPGSGKTTLAWQMCENLALAGEECLYFTLEQSKLDLVTKSIIRRIKLQDMNTGATIQDIKDGTIKATQQQREIIQEIGDRISIIEGNFSLSARDICDRIETYIKQTGKKPVVFVDYLQALKPLEDKKRTGNREAIEDTTDLLSGIKNKHDLTMIVISSISRVNYRAALDIDSLKESGRLEFSADAVYCLEYACMYEDSADRAGHYKLKEFFESDGDINKKKSLLADAKAKNPRYMMLKCVKSRYCGGTPIVKMKYYSGADLFMEESDFTPDTGRENPFTDTAAFRQRRN